MPRFFSTCWFRSVVAVILGLAAMAAGLSAVPGKQTHIAQTQPTLVSAGKPLALMSGEVFEQRFVARDAEFSAVGIELFPVAVAPGCTLHAVLAESNGSVIADSRQSCEGFERSQVDPTLMSFSPQKSSDGTHYVLSLRVEGAAGSKLVTVPAVVTDPQTQDAMTIKGDSQRLKADVIPPSIRQSQLAVVPLYQNASVLSDWLDSIRTAAVMTPWWGQPAALAVWAIGGLACLATLLSVGYRSRRLGAVLILGVAMFQGMLWAALIPMLDGMDEPQHLSYVQYLAEQGLPDPRVSGLNDSYSPQLGQLLHASRLFAIAPTDRYAPGELSTVAEQVLQASPLNEGRPVVTQYSPVYYLIAALAYRLSPYGGVERFYDVRLASVILGMVTALGIYFFARQALPRRPWVASCLAAAVVLQPMMAHQGAIVNNDVFIFACSSWALALSVAAMRSSRRRLLLVMAASLAALAATSKPQGIIILGIVVVAECFSWRTVVWRDRLRDVLGMGAGVAVFYGGWLLLRTVIGAAGPQLPSRGGALDRSVGTYIHMQIDNHFYVARTRWSHQLFGNFGWLDVYLDQTIYNVISVVLLLVIAVWCVWAVGRGLCLVVSRERNLAEASNTRWNLQMLWVSGLLVLGFLIAINIIGYLGFRADGTDTILQGRYVLPMLPGLFAIPVLLLDRGSILLRRHTRLAEVVSASAAWVAAALAWSMLALNVLGLGSVIERFFG